MFHDQRWSLTKITRCKPSSNQGVGIKKIKKTTYLLGAAILASGCSVTPKPLTMDQLADKRSYLQEQYTADQEAVTQPIGLYEAMARAIKYNLDYNTKGGSVEPGS